jgi:hypothetical protein
VSQSEKEKPRVVEGIVLGRDGQPLQSYEGQAPPRPGLRVFKPSPLMVAGAILALPLLLILLVAFALFMTVFLLVAGRKPKVVVRGLRF